MKAFYISRATLVRGSLYVVVIVIQEFLSQFEAYKTEIQNLTPTQILLLSLKCVLGAALILRAYLDQTVSRNEKLKSAAVTVSSS